MSQPPIPPTVGVLKDPVSVFKQRVDLLEGENTRLRNELLEARQEVGRLLGKSPQLVLEEFLSELESHRMEAEPPAMDSEPEAPAVDAEPESPTEPPREETDPPRRGHGPRTQQKLRKVRKVFDLPEDEQSCTLCGGALEKMGDQVEASELIDLVRLEYVVTQVERKKYRCRCNGCVKTAPGPTRAISGGRYSLDFALHVAESKYLDHMPLERLCRQMARCGLEVTSQTLWDQLFALAGSARATYDALGLEVLRSAVMHADETRWPRLDGKGNANWTVWGRCTPRIAHYSILAGRSKKVSQRLFRGYEGIVVVDGYGVYESLARDGPGMKLSHCWAHALRKFQEIEGNFPKTCGEILSKIRALYAVECEVSDESPGPFPGGADAQQRRLTLRQEKSTEILRDLRDYLTTAVGLPRSDLGKAVRYVLKRWESLTRFVENPLVPLDNNAAERALRGPVVGRKNHYGSKSKRGTEVAAIFYTLFETAKLCGVDPARYARTVIERALDEPGAVTFPWDL